MESPMVKATFQATLLSALSNILAQLISCWRSDSPFAINPRDLAAFATFSIISCPPNYIWQSWLEATFPGYTESLTSREKEKLVDEVIAGGSSSATDASFGKQKPELRGEKQGGGAMTAASAPPSAEKIKKKLNVRNTAAKFFLDQTIGAAANTVLFMVGIALLQGRSLSQGVDECRQSFWPLIFAGQKLWPLVSVISLTLVPVERRMVFGSVIGVGWGIFLSLISGEKDKAKIA